MSDRISAVMNFKVSKTFSPSEVTVACGVTSGQRSLKSELFQLFIILIG